MLLTIAIIIAYTIEFVSAYIFYSAAAEKKVKQSTCYLVGVGLFGIACTLNILANQTIWLNLLFYILVNVLYAYICFNLNVKSHYFMDLYLLL
jgi:hypothetical protein